MLHFQGDSDAHIVRGLVAIIFTLYDGKSAKEILAIEPETVFSALGLKDHLSPSAPTGSRRWSNGSARTRAPLLTA